MSPQTLDPVLPGCSLRGCLEARSRESGGRDAQIAAVLLSEMGYLEHDGRRLSAETVDDLLAQAREERRDSLVGDMVQACNCIRAGKGNCPLGERIQALAGATGSDGSAGT